MTVNGKLMVSLILSEIMHLINPVMSDDRGHVLLNVRSFSLTIVWQVQQQNDLLKQRYFIDQELEFVIPQKLQVV